MKCMVILTKGVLTVVLHSVHQGFGRFADCAKIPDGRFTPIFWSFYTPFMVVLHPIFNFFLILCIRRRSFCKTTVITQKQAFFGGTQYAIYGRFTPHLWSFYT